ncbi:MAG TPA: zinc ribbon domain-containing protein [Vicinamibacterales bacterium]|jgi:putative FmdB family regulatory protein
MPLYDFVCRACGREFEALVRPQDAPPACPACRSADLTRQVSSFALSTDERREAAALTSRKRQIAGRKDALIAEEEARQHHDD